MASKTEEISHTIYDNVIVPTKRKVEATPPCIEEQSSIVINFLIFDRTHLVMK